MEVEICIDGGWFDEIEFTCGRDIHNYLKGEWVSSVVNVFNARIDKGNSHFKIDGNTILPSESYFAVHPDKYGKSFEAWFEEVCNKSWRDLVMFGNASIGEYVDMEEVTNVED